MLFPHNAKTITAAIERLCRSMPNYYLLQEKGENSIRMEIKDGMLGMGFALDINLQEQGEQTEVATTITAQGKLNTDHERMREDQALKLFEKDLAGALNS